MLKEDKVFYDKRFVYLDYLERGNKVKNGGYFKWEVKGNTCRIMIHIRGLYPTDTMQGEILICSHGVNHPAGYMELLMGKGEYAAVWCADDLAGTGVKASEFDGVQIRISEKRGLLGLWRDTVPEEIKNEEVSAPENELTNEKVLVSENELENKEVLISESDLEDKEVLMSEGELENKEVSASEKALSLCTDKWQQLKMQFVGVTPFQDGREYLSITPRDFIVLPGKYQNLVQNSFLLHGYYNYGHIVLAREKGKPEDKYYLGVPGVYYDREKQVALMFGFEGFEGGKAQISDGGFGYYMMKVEI